MARKSWWSRGMSALNKFWPYGAAAAGGLIGSTILPGLGTMGGIALGGTLGSAQAAAGKYGSKFVRGGSPEELRQQQMQQQGQPGQDGDPRYSIHQVGPNQRVAEIPTRSQGQQSLVEKMRDAGFMAEKNLPSAEFGPVEDYYNQQYRDKYMPKFLSQFPPGAMSGSGFQQLLGQEGANFGGQLAAQREQFNMQRRGQEHSRAMSLINPYLTPEFTPHALPQDPPSAGQQFLGQVGEGAASSIPILAALAFDKFAGKTGQDGDMLAQFKKWWEGEQSKQAKADASLDPSQQQQQVFGQPQNPAIPGYDIYNFLRR